MILLLRVAAIVFVALSLGASFAHVLELPAKLQLAGDPYLAVQGIYRYFGAVATRLICVPPAPVSFVQRQRGSVRAIQEKPPP